MRPLSSEFLAPGARLGTWWVPADDDLNDEGDFDTLPQRREPGVLLPKANGGWALLLARQLPAESVSARESLLSDRQECGLMWGDVLGSAISLFDGRMGSSTNAGSYSHLVRRGEWYVESPMTWVDRSSRVRRVDINFAAGGAWSERPPGEGLDIDLQRQWDEDFTTFTRPEPVVYEAEVGDATVQLRRETVFTMPSDELYLRLSTVLSVEDDVELGDIRDNWVAPLYDLVSFFWLKNPVVVWIRVQLAGSKLSADVHYAGRLARADEDYKPPMSDRLAQFATLQGILAHGYGFEDLICRYWCWRKRGYGRALELLIESQDPQLDQSVDASLLNAIKSLETYVRTQKGKSGKVKLDKASEGLLVGAGQVGGDIRDIWQVRGQQHFGNSIAQLRGNYVAHEQIGTIITSRSKDELLDHYWHLVALQWLLRRTYLQAMGIDAEAATALVTSSLGYKQDCRKMREHYRISTTPIK